MPHAPRWCVGLALLCALGACTDDGPTDPSTTEPSTSLDDPWQPTTVPYDPSCASGCEELGSLHAEHADTTIRVRRQAGVDSSVVQWFRCIGEVGECTRTEGAIAPCVAASGCPAVCREEYGRRIGDAADEDARREAFMALFAVRGAPCTPREEELSP